jgi:retinol dehydrogenase-14
VVNFAGDFHRKATIDFDDLMSAKDCTGLRANNQAKLALIMFTYELACRLDGDGRLPSSRGRGDRLAVKGP